MNDGNRRLGALLIDDESIVRRLMRTMLLDLECEVAQEASNGDDGIARFRELRPDLVFIDINMPGMGGFAVLKAILEIDPAAFAVMVSADSTVDNVRGAIAGGAQGFIVKPFTAARFQDLLDKLRRQRSEAGRPAA